MAELTQKDASLAYKVVLAGTVKLKSPLLIGSGTEEGKRNEADIHVLKDRESRPFIPGTSLAGVLRNWMIDARGEGGRLFFGDTGKNAISEEGSHSAVAFFDIPLGTEEKPAVLTIRDGVSIDSATGIGIDGHKYDYEAVERGAEGPFYGEITIRQILADGRPQWKDDVKALVNRLTGGIRLGAMTAKGFGLVSIDDIQAKFYDFSKMEDVSAWLRADRRDMRFGDVYQGVPEAEERKDTFVIDGRFSLRHSLIVRDQDVDGEEKINAVQLKSGGDFVIPGTSLKGALRHRAEEIFRVLGKSEGLLKDLMGYANEGEGAKGRKSRFLVGEVYFEQGVKEAKQSRIRIDRFTGGTISSALFTEQPVWKKRGDDGNLSIHMEIEHAKPWEAGLALLLLKDLWTGDLAVGGEKSVGRGVLEGKSGEIKFQGAQWQLDGQGRVTEGSAADLERFVTALHDERKEEGQ